MGKYQHAGAKSGRVESSGIAAIDARPLASHAQAPAQQASAVFTWIKLG
jgi:hypothetical protein